MAWPNETSTTSGTTPNGTAYRSARFNAPGSSAQGNIYVPTEIADGSAVTLVVAAHGSGGSAAMLDTAGFVPVREALLDDGYVVVAGSLSNTWGNALAMANLTAIYAWVDSVWDVERVLLCGQSQGGGVMMTALLRKIFPNVVAVVGIAPALNYQWVSDFGASSATIRTAYAADAETFPAAVEGYAALTGTPADYAGIYFHFFASDADTTTPPPEHAEKFYADGLAAEAAAFTITPVTGGHLSTDHYRADAVSTFFRNALSPAGVTFGDLHMHDGIAWVPVELGAYVDGVWRMATAALMR